MPHTGILRRQCDIDTKKLSNSCRNWIYRTVSVLSISLEVTVRIENLIRYSRCATI